MLGYYADQLPTVELNNTFYRMPKPEVVARWADETGDDFRFVIKASRRITHIKRLKDPAENVEYLYKVLAPLKGKLGAVLFQLPPNMKKNLERLQAFLDALPDGHRAAFEFRNDTWFDDQVYGALRDAGAALCAADSVDLPLTELVETTDWGYLRLRRMDYGPEALSAWAEKIAQTDWSEAFVFFKHEEAGAGPKMAGEFLELVG